jgi:cytochrome b
MAIETAKPARTWDPLVRLTHWGIALAVLVNGALVREGSDWHVWVGTAMAALLAVRLLWGFIGPREARFMAFPPSPARAIAHVRDIFAGRRETHRSHNPLGALMAYALWACLAVLAVTGLTMSGLPGSARPATAEAALSAPLATGAAEAEEEEEEAHEGRTGAANGEAAGAEGEEWMEEVHEAAANLLFLLAALHVAGVLFETRRSGRHVITRMTGGQGG